MYDWLNNLASNLDKETVVVLSTGASMFVAGIITSMRGKKNGQPTATSVTETAKEITRMSCGAPEVAVLAREALNRINDLQNEMDRMQDKLTRIEDRTR